MKIIVAGCGKVGFNVAKDLASEDGTDIIIIDIKPEVIDRAAETVDAMLIRGNCLNTSTLIEAGAKDADLIVTVTDADETNILCCILAKRLGTRHTIARIRHPEIALDLDKIWRDLGLDMAINPEYEAAREISRLLRFPAVEDIDTFQRGRVELVSFKVSDTSEFFVGKSVAELFYRKNYGILLATVERNDTLTIPKGDFIFEENDIIRILGRPANVMSFLTLIGKNMERIKSVAIIGGSKITYYLLALLKTHLSGISIKVIDISKEKCEDLSERFPKCLIINGDGTDEELLSSEIIGQTEAVICLTSKDEENAVIALYSMSANFRKVILKIDHIHRNLVRNLQLGSIVSPKNLTSENIIRYVRGMSMVGGNQLKAVNTIFSNESDSVEAVELVVDSSSKCINTPLKQLKIKKGILIGCITRNSDIIIPTGDTELHPGDTVVLIAKNEAVLELDDVLVSFSSILSSSLHF